MSDRAVRSQSGALSGSRAAVIARYGLGLGLAVVVTILLLWVMRSLIATGDDTLAESKTLRPIDIVRVEREPEPIRSRRSEPPAALDPPPEIQSAERFEQPITVVNPIPAPMEPSREIEFDWRGFSIDDGDIMMVMAVSPGYPRRALERGIEGYCTVQFTVTQYGAVRDPVIVEDECTHLVFHRSALAAASKTKYKPRIIDGQPVEVSGWKLRFRYELND